MILDILDNIKNSFINVVNALNVCTINVNTNNNIYIVNMYDVDKKILAKLDQKIIEQHRYNKLKKLYMHNNKKINNLNHLKNTLQVLDCGLEYDSENTQDELEYIVDIMRESRFLFAKKYKEYMEKIKYVMDCWSGGIKSSRIAELCLSELRCDNNMHITNISHMAKTLKILSCCGISGINQEAISCLNLEKLKCDENPKIRNVNHMRDTLKILKCRGSLHAMVDDNMMGNSGISELKLEKIHFGGNPFIKNLDHMKDTLLLLDIDAKGRHGMTSISQKEIDQLKLRELYLGEEIEEINLNHMSETLTSLKMYNFVDLSKMKLQKLHIGRKKGLNLKSKLEKLRKYVSIEHMKDTLESLIIESSGFVRDEDIHKLKLDCSVLKKY